jgi:hypothetical protein
MKAVQAYNSMQQLMPPLQLMQLLGCPPSSYAVLQCYPAGACTFSTGACLAVMHTSTLLLVTSTQPSNM